MQRLAKPETNYLKYNENFNIIQERNFKIV